MDNDKCQGIDEDGITCEETKDLKRFEVHGQEELYRRLWVHVNLCPECADKYGLV